MDASATPARARWLYALKPASWPKLFVPMLLGQAIGVSASGRFAWPGCIVGALFTGFGLGFIVLLNDWGDRGIDALKRKLLPDAGSPKTIPDGILSARQVLTAGLALGALALATAILGGALLDRPSLGAMGAGAMLLFVAYTLPPVRLNYRGGGELLEMLGVGGVLPWINAYAQSGLLVPAGVRLLPGFALLALASAIASGLGDELSDREGGKTTVVTTFGNAASRRFAEAAVLAGGTAWAFAAFGASAPTAWVLAPPLAAVLSGYFGMLRHGPHADTRAFAAQARYKQALHRAIWAGGALLAAGLVVARAFGS